MIDMDGEEIRSRQLFGRRIHHYDHILRTFAGLYVQLLDLSVLVNTINGRIVRSVQFKRHVPLFRPSRQQDYLFSIALHQHTL